MSPCFSQILQVLNLCICCSSNTIIQKSPKRKLLSLSNLQMYTGVSSELQTLILNCILDITFICLKGTLNSNSMCPKAKSLFPSLLKIWSASRNPQVNQSTIHPVLPLRNLSCLTASSYSTISIYHQVLPILPLQCPSKHLLPFISNTTTPPPQPILTWTTALASKHPLCFLYIYSGPYQSVLHTLARVIISEYKTNHVTMHILFKNLQMSPCCSWDQDQTPQSHLQCSA